MSHSPKGIRPLDGIRVVSLEHAVAAPFATRQLADLGARVIKVERPGAGDFARGYDQSVHGQASYFVWLNRGKESLTLDLKDDEAQSILHRLLADADVLVQNLAPGAAARMGLDFDTLHGKYEKLIVCDISGYGDSGPYRDKKAYDLLIHQAAAGLVGLTAGPNERRAPAFRSPISRPACTPTVASSRHCCSVDAPAKACASRSPCSRRWPSG